MSDTSDSDTTPAGGLPAGLENYPDIHFPANNPCKNMGDAQLITVHDSSILGKTGLDRVNPRDLDY
jgi:hypothetical protein